MSTLSSSKPFQSKEEDTFYGKKYGTFSWVRGTIDIYDLDDLKYVAICLKKMRKRLRAK